MGVFARPGTCLPSSAICTGVSRTYERISGEAAEAEAGTERSEGAAAEAAPKGDKRLGIPWLVIDMLPAVPGIGIGAPSISESV